jgi:hypothetical protein
MRLSRFDGRPFPDGQVETLTQLQNALPWLGFGQDRQLKLRPTRS